MIHLKNKKTKHMELSKQPIRDVHCPLCNKSLVFPNADDEIKIGNVVKEKIFLVQKGGKIPDRVMVFKIIRGNGEEGFTELSLVPGDYQKYVSLPLHPEEEVTFICPHCRKSMNDKKGLVKILVKQKSEEVIECFIYPRYGIEITLYQTKDGSAVKTYYGEKYQSLAEYFEKAWKKINERE